MNKKDKKLLAIKNLFQNPMQVYSRDEILRKPCPIPNQPGIYAWYFKNLSDVVPIEGCVTYEDLKLLYAGISPSRPLSRQNLRRRLKNHFRGNASGSTLRLTLGCLLSDTLGLKLRKVGKSGRMTFGEGEQKLTEWMSENAFVAWFVCYEPWIVETKLFYELSLPFNLRNNQHNNFHQKLSALRKSAKAMARIETLDK